MGKRSLFISFEGGEGSGKSSQIDFLFKYLIDHSFDVVVVRNPGSSSIGEQIREILLDPNNSSIYVKTEVFLHAASLYENLKTLILPSLEAGKIVICDRYIDSALAYQGYARDVELDFIQMIVHKEATEALIPDVTIYLDVPAEYVVTRTAGRRKTTEARIENEPLEFHRKIRQAYLEIAQAHPQRIAVVDGTQSFEKVATGILEIITPLLRS